MKLTKIKDSTGMAAVQLLMVLLMTFFSCSGKKDRPFSEISTNRSFVQEDVKPSDEMPDKYKKQTHYTDPGEYAYLYEGLPESIEEINDLIKKQLIHPFEASEMKDIIPKERYNEDGDFPSVYAMLSELLKRDTNGLTIERKPEERLVVACYHHALLLASILRSQGLAVRMRAGFSRYFEKQANIRFGHVVCEVWDEEENRWIMVDPDRNYNNVSHKQFEFSSQAWQNFRKNQLPDITYTSSLGKGSRTILKILLLDQAFVLNDERGYWHTPSFLFANDFSVDELNKRQIEIIDKIALLLNEPGNHIDELRRLYDENSFLHAKERSLDAYFSR